MLPMDPHLLPQRNGQIRPRLHATAGSGSEFTSGQDGLRCPARGNWPAGGGGVEMGGRGFYIAYFEEGALAGIVSYKYVV